MNLSNWKLAVQSMSIQNAGLKSRVAALLFFVLLINASCVHAQSNKIQQSEQILQPAGDIVEHDTFGTAVAISGNTMVIGGVNADGVEVGAGAAFIFERTGNTWVQTARLFAADGRAEPVPFGPGLFRSDSFGSTVAISGDTVIVGAPGHAHPGFPSDSGAVYVFQRVDGVWTQQAELFSPHPNNQDEFGAGDGFGGLAISGDIIAVTDQGRSIVLPGAVDIFTRTNGSWAFTTQLTVPDDFFFLPSSVAFDGSMLVVGSSQSDAPGTPFAGVAYVFRYDQGQWSKPVTLAATDASSGSQFGSSVGLSKNAIAVGAITAPGLTAQSGAVYVFANKEDGWNQAAKLIALDGTDLDSFGFSVAIDGQKVLVGATGHTPAETGVQTAGSAYLFEQRDGQWQQIAELFASDGISGGDFGAGVTVVNNTLLIGADLQHPPVEGYPGGEAYIFTLNH